LTEKAILKAAGGQEHQDLIPAASRFLGEDVDIDLFQSELRRLKSLEAETLHDLIKEFSNKKLNQFFPQITVALKLLIVIPVNSASAERSFSALRHKKTSTQRLRSCLRFSPCDVKFPLFKSRESR